MAIDTAAFNAGYSDWDFHNIHVMNGATPGQFINAESTLVASGPATISGEGAAAAVVPVDVFPIGLLETFGLQQSRQLQRIFEIGSSRSYFVPGRTIGNITLGRTFYYGPSLLRVLYANYALTLATGGALSSLATDADIAAEFVAHSVPGYDNFLINLASDLFAQPTGMAVYFKDTMNATYGGFYLENNYPQGHQMTVSSGSVLIMEGASMQYEMLVPLDISSDV